MLLFMIRRTYEYLIRNAVLDASVQFPVDEGKALPYVPRVNILK